jgi:hypothetical protein
MFELRNFTTFGPLAYSQWSRTECESDWPSWRNVRNCPLAHSQMRMSAWNRLRKLGTGEIRVLESLFSIEFAYFHFRRSNCAIFIEFAPWPTVKWGWVLGICVDHSKSAPLNLARLLVLLASSSTSHLAFQWHRKASASSRAIYWV